MATPASRNAIWAESGDVTIPSQGEQQSGYVAGKPSRRKTNWLLNWIDNAIQWVMAFGLPVYNAATVYPPKARCQDSSGYSWQRIGSGDTTDVTPEEGEYWTRWGHTIGQVNDAIDAREGTRSGAAVADTITSDNTDYTIGYAYIGRFPGSTVKTVFVRLTIEAQDQMNLVLTLSGATAFATGADNVLVSMAQNDAADGERPYAVVTGNQTVEVGIADPQVKDYTVELMIQGH